MSMVTQCPHCSTAFNVTPEQLFARDGRVRCGNCRQVFDGLVNLTSLEALEAGVPPPLAETSDAEVRERAEALDGADPAMTAPIAASGFTPTGWPMVPDVPEVPVPPQPAVNAEEATGAANENTATAQIAAQEPAIVPPAIAQADVAAEDAKVPSGASRRRSWPWAIAATLAALVLCAQALHSYRSEVAAHFPRLRPALAQLCTWAQCTIPPLQLPSALTIQASDLLILDKVKPHLVQLIVTLQNQSNLEVGYPAIDLVLNDRFDHAVARRVFLPNEYLRGAEARKTVIAASVTTTVRIDLDLSDLAAGGFGLLLIPAPQT